MADDVEQRLADMRERADRYGVIESGDFRVVMGAVEDVLALHVPWGPAPDATCIGCGMSTPCPTVAAITKRLGTSA